MITELIMNIFIKLDNYISGPFLDGIKNEKAGRIAAMLTHLGDAIAHIPLFLFFYFFCSDKFKQFASVTFFSTIIGVIILFAFRFVFKRQRPIGNMPKEYALLPAMETYSFPSGHAMRNFLFCVTAYPFFGIYVSATLFIFAAIIVSTRVYLRLHYFSDILAGALLGITSAYFYLRFINIYTQ